MSTRLLPRPVYYGGRNKQKKQAKGLVLAASPSIDAKFNFSDEMRIKKTCELR